VSQHVSADLRRQVRNRFGNCCAYCRTAEAITVALFEVDHIIPNSAGGKTVFENLCLACPTCNRYKAARTVAEDPDTRMKRSRCFIRIAMFGPITSRGIAMQPRYSA